MLTLALVDDSGILRAALKNVLEADGYRVLIEAENSSELFSQLEKNPVDVVLLDVFFPTENGLDILVQ